jgi:hypothetical protein
LAAAANERGVFSLDGQMVDAPVLRLAQHILAPRRPELGRLDGNKLEFPRPPGTVPVAGMA